MFLMIQSSDHITGLTGASPTVVLSKNGATFAAPAGAVTEVGNGWYKVAGNATDTDTLGPLALHATTTSADPSDILVAEIVAYNPQDAVHLGLSCLPNTAVTTNASLLTSGTGTDQLSVASGRIDLGKILGTASAGTAGYMAPDWGHINAPTTTVALTNTTISNTQVVASVTGAVGSVTGAVGSVTGNVGGNVNGSVGSVASGGIVTASIAAGSIVTGSFFTGAITSAVLNASAENAIADALLARNIAGGSSSGRIVSEALYPLRNLWSVNTVSGVYSVYMVDDTTVAWTSSLTTNAAAIPITGSDPA
jgi:hypothetical protein